MEAHRHDKKKTTTPSVSENIATQGQQTKDEPQEIRFSLSLSLSSSNEYRSFRAFPPTIKNDGLEYRDG
jgi:hypothetical protein